MVDFKTFLVFLFLFISVFGDDYKTFAHSRSKTIDFRSLANNLDEYFKKFSGISSHSKRNKYQSKAHSGEVVDVDAEDDYDDDGMIGFRGNFGSDDKAGPTPHDIMRSNSEDPPVSTHQWQSMMAPFVPIIPAVGEFCSCKGVGNCGCCIGFFVKPLSLKNNVCLNVSMTKDPATKSSVMARARIYYDVYKILDLSVSEKQPPMACVSLPLFPSFAGCAQIGNFHEDKKERKGCVCASVMLQRNTERLLHTPYLCACFGSPYEEKQKNGIFGWDVMGIIGSINSFFLKN